MAAGIRIGARRKPAVVGVGGEAGPDLLAVDDVLVAVAHRAGLQGGQVGAGVGLAVADAEMQIAARILGRKKSFCSCVPNCMMVGPTVFMVSMGTGAPALHRLVEEDELLRRGQAATAVLGGPAHAEPLIGAHLPHDLAHGLADAAAACQLGPYLGSQQLPK